MNHGYNVFNSYICISAYKPHGEGLWALCPHCNLEPKVWIYDNGKGTACGCGNNEYDHFSVMAESIMSVYRRCGGKTGQYNSDQLRLNWNEYCATMINPCSHGDLYFEEKR